MPDLWLPNRNESGLALIPSLEDTAPVDEHFKDWEMQERHGSDHHLYWPGRFYFNAGLVAYSFRKHRLNILKNVDREGHNNIHWRYDRLVEAQPDVLMPDQKTMESFLGDAVWIDLMWQHAGAIKGVMGNKDKAKNPDEMLEKRDKLLIMVRQAAEYALESSILPVDLVQVQLDDLNSTFGIDLGLRAAD